MTLPSVGSLRNDDLGKPDFAEHPYQDEDGTTRMRRVLVTRDKRTPLDLHHEAVTRQAVRNGQTTQDANVAVLVGYILELRDHLHALEERLAMAELAVAIGSEPAKPARKGGA